MVSIRRTLSLVPRPGTLVNGEACSVASPLSKSSSCNQNYPPSGGLPSFSSSDYGFYKVQAFLLGLFSQRSSRPPERPKLKGQVWRRSIFHFLICFCVGIFVGLTPFVSMNLSMNYISEDQDFPFKKFSLAPGNETTIEGLPIRNDSVPLEPHVTNGDIGNGTFDDTVGPQLIDQDPTNYKQTS